MSQVHDIPKTFEEAVMSLATWDGEEGADDLRIYSADDVGDDVVRLIHVSDEFPIFKYVSVFTFGASEEFPFKTSVALARPEQWDRIKTGENDLGLPPDWKFTHGRQVWPRSQYPKAP